MAIEKLREYRGQQRQKKLKMDNKWEENDLVFPTLIGIPMDLHNLPKAFNAFLSKAGLPPM